MKKAMLIISLVIFMFSFVGCWDYMEYEQMTQIYALGVDLDAKSNEVTITLQYIPIARSMGEKANTTNSTGTVYSASGITIIDALTKLQQTSPNKLFFGYLQVIVISEDAAKYLMKDIVVFFDSISNIRNSVNIIIVPGSAQGTIATRDPNSETSSGKKMHMLLSSSQSNGTTYSVTLHDYLQMMDREGVEPVAPRILTTALSSDPGEALGGTRDGIRFTVEKNGNILASGMAAFKKDKFVGWLNDKESMGLNWILGNRITSYKTSNIDKLSTNKDEKDLPLHADLRKMLYYYITKSGSKIKVKIENNQPVIYLEIKVEAALKKYYSNNGNDYISPDIVNSIEEKLSRSINSDIMAALENGKHKLNSDIFGFGFSFYRQHPKEWNKYYKGVWDDIFHDIPVRVNVQTKINNTGTNIKRFQIK